MKFNKSSQLLLVSAASLLVAGLVTACGTLTVDFVFVASSKAAGPNNYGQINVFEINQESGFMRQIPTSPFPSGGRNPVAEAISADNADLYVVNEDDNTIVQFVIGNDGKVYPQNTVNTPGIFPLAVAISGTNLYVVDTYQPLPSCSPAAPCSGSVAAFPITVGTGSNPSDTMGTPAANGSLNYWPLCQYGYISATNFTQCATGATSNVITPTAVNVLASGANVYISAYDSSVTPHAGYIFAFAASSGGGLTPLNGGVPFPAGSQPSAIASDSTSTYVYVTDLNNGNVLGYSVASGLLTPLSSSPFPAGDQPSAVVADPKYPFVYVANSLDATVQAYSMNNGALTSIGTYQTGTQPVAIGIDPSTNHFLYTTNYLGNGVSGTVSGFELSPTAGTLLNSQNSPYLSNALPTAVVAIPHGSSQSSSGSK
ncbi:MAG: beta-propeller fold lactonase family protein [Terracidiphilus sp.]